MRLRVTPGGPLCGDIQVAADKSISHRAVILAAIATGVSGLRNLSQGEDVRATLAAFRSMGVRIEQRADGEVEIEGAGLHGLCQPPREIDLGNSGTAMRLLAGLLCAQRWSSTLTGDASLKARPMARIIEPLTRMGAVIQSIQSRAGGTDARPPLAMTPVPRLRGSDFSLPVASAQVKSALLLAGLYAKGATTVTAPAPTRDHTERMLAAFGAPVEPVGGDGIRAGVRGGGALRAVHMRVPADLSAAAFFIVGASVIGGSEVLLRGVGVNPTRDGILAILRRMGADIEVRARREVSGEPVADIRVRAAALRGCRIDAGDVALAIDEIPAIAVAAACADGATSIRGAGELRVKESDRISRVAAGLAALGVAVEEHADGLTITGGRPRGGRVDSGGDHRIAMAFAVAGGAADGAVEVADCANIATSFPEFCPVARDAGLRIEAGDDD
ncbi:MAG: 3-phosphoshikimate 1-carboxyvinyltransferase [Gammaproteobacteria bacterium]|nr:3-phosphoshikimate 1-carboxyvinyltransferase [Gammaproteobacteria bacterium]